MCVNSEAALPTAPTPFVVFLLGFMRVWQFLCPDQWPEGRPWARAAEWLGEESVFWERVPEGKLASRRQGGCQLPPLRCMCLFTSTRALSAPLWYLPIITCLLRGCFTLLRINSVLQRTPSRASVTAGRVMAKGSHAGARTWLLISASLLIHCVTLN